MNLFIASISPEEGLGDEAANSTIPFVGEQLQINTGIVLKYLSAKNVAKSLQVKSQDWRIRLSVFTVGEVPQNTRNWE